MRRRTLRPGIDFRKKWVAVAIILGDDNRLAKAHFHNMLGPVHSVGASIGAHYTYVIDAEPLFNAIRAAVDARP